MPSHNKGFHHDDRTSIYCQSRPHRVESGRSCWLYRAWCLRQEGGTGPLKCCARGSARDHACCCACPGSACRGNTSRSGLGQVNELRGCRQNACGPGLCFTGHSTLRSKRKTISFNKPFSLKGLDGVQPAGDYEIVTDEKRIETTLFEAWQRVGTQIRLPSLAVDTGIEQYTTIEPGDLEDALRSDHPTDEVRRLERFHD